ncbi:hypothetical protein Lal_00049033 [Lupinus albus]|nr:hypothetical protein Lal_00049033 [Lupinus albus]
MGQTLFDKIWDAHVVSSAEGFPDILYIDTHFIHEVTSPQAFDGLRKRGLPVFRPQQTVATADHNVPTWDQHLPIKEELSRYQVDMLTKNCKEFGIELYGLGHPYQGIVHVIGPELGITRPGGLATQCLLQSRPKRMKIEVNGKLQKGVGAKDIILYIIAQISAAGGTGYAVEYAGDTIRSLSMEGRMTICNMSIEMGARCGLIAPDETTINYVKGREFAPKGEEWDKAVAYWQTLYSDEDAEFDSVLSFRAEDIEPMITYGTNPGMGIGVTQHVPETASLDIKSNCTNSRIEDLRQVAEFVKGKHKADNVTVWVVPGSKQVQEQAIREGLDKIFNEAGFPLREPGCSACLGMNEDKIPAGKYCVSTSNRNFEGRQGPNSRTFLASPLTAAASAITGKVTDIREFLKEEELV